MKLFFILSVGAFASKSVSREVANSFLSRTRRENGNIFEEMASGNLERECVEEICSIEEFHEVYDNLARSGKSVTFKHFLYQYFIPKVVILQIKKSHSHFF